MTKMEMDRKTVFVFFLFLQRSPGPPQGHVTSASRPHIAFSFVVERDKEIQEWNDEQKLPTCCVVTVEAGYQEEALKKQLEKKRRQRRTAEKEESGMKWLKKWLRASSRRQARTQMPSRPHKEQSGK